MGRMCLDPGVMRIRRRGGRGQDPVAFEAGGGGSLGRGVVVRGMFPRG